MLSYRHAYHAGNFADVHKHAVLTLLLEALKAKHKGFCYIETHAGAGRYSLAGGLSQQASEYRRGIDLLWRCADFPASLAPYIDAVRCANKGVPERLRNYPGSPCIAHALLRPQDSMRLAELHPTDAQCLQTEFAAERNVVVEQRDGYQALQAWLPPSERRGLVLLDPAYERKDERQRLVQGVLDAYRRWPTGIYALWYPLRERGFAESLQRALSATGIRRILVAQLSVRAPSASRAMKGSALAVINPPWRLEQALEPLLSWLCTRLAADDAGRWRVHWLVPE